MLCEEELSVINAYNTSRISRGESNNRLIQYADLNSRALTRGGEAADSCMVQAIQPLFISEQNG
jgi:hypothetical protein